ncbi:c-type cytochrome [Jannaschia sp. W003]|uniref:c-type cytochrome n=1 Tax=Jannaschia sp. W003 TaxID=2867012 RepID=UPI0021A3A252|nr:c-type cytochrome [Jannaschia sp. W003]UWQ22952.1 c-type cytochrome [Jannaschia sp. W003]
MTRLRRALGWLHRHPRLEVLAILAMLAGLAGGATVAFGLYNVSADAPHLPPTRWALHTTYRQAVRLRAPPEAAIPADLMAGARIGLGARHFDAACRQCHAAPGERRTATQEAMRPEPPHVTRAVENWAPRHLHWILREGVKMSGMPAWPGHRADEPWSAVAFLEAVRDMDAEGYAALTEAPAEGTWGYCAGCHGTDGVGRLGPYVPRLDILGASYLAMSLEAYRTGLRRSGYMQHAATEVSEADLGAMAARFGALPVGPSGPGPDPALAEAGEALAKRGTLDDPSCASCHGDAATRPARAEFPALNGQHEGYLAAQLRLWRDGARGGGARSHLMTAAARDLSDGEIAALAAYYAALPPRGFDPEDR